MAQRLTDELKATLQLLIVVDRKQRQLTGEEMTSLGLDMAVEQAKGKLALISTVCVR